MLLSEEDDIIQYHNFQDDSHSTHQYRSKFSTSYFTGTVLLAVLSLTNAVLQQDVEDEVASEGSAQVEVRAVFIKCSQDYSDLKVFTKTLFVV